MNGIGRRGSSRDHAVWVPAFAGTTTSKILEMMDRAVADAETIGGRDCGADERLGVARRG
jgi:hypothetical protein